MYYVLNSRICGTIDNPLEIPDELRKEYSFVDTVEYLKECKTDEDKIQTILNNANVYWEYYFDGDILCVEIEWGDWKHDHRFCDGLMKSIGYKLISEEVTDSDGSDAYSSVHTYRKE